MNDNTTLWNRLRAVLDTMFYVNNRTGSTAKVVTQSFDMAEMDHVVLIEYRARVMPPDVIESDQMPSKQVKRAPMESIRELFAQQHREHQA
ncbi:hypothetical protein ABIC33_003193 [Variovorax sp. 1140]|uniref:hypothetical protein n=1 Tax=Variovorax atrisoli TaxID=3394203 RepID=UPI0033996327